jgi:hypothetical protein
MSADNIVRAFPKKKLCVSISMLISFPSKVPEFNRFLTVRDQHKLTVFVFEIISIIPELLCKNYFGNGTVTFCLSGTGTVTKWNHKRRHDKFLGNNAASNNIKVKIFYHFYFILTAFYGLDK